MSDSEDSLYSKEKEFGFSEDLVASPVHKAAVTGSLDFDGLLSRPLRLHEDLSEGNGGQAWPAGMILARYLLSQRLEEMKATKEIVELGAGGGLTGLAVALGCHSTAPESPGANVQPTIYVTDQPYMQALLEHNIKLNDVSFCVKAATYSWGNPRPSEVPEYPAIILAADCVYFEPAFPLLLQTLQDLIGPDSTCYFCFKKRRRADMQFPRAIKKIFQVDEVSDDPRRPEYQRENIYLYTIRRKK